MLSIALLPSWAQPQAHQPGKETINNKKSQHTSSAYMDGLRGLVAVLVFIRHFTLPWQDHIDYGYGHQGTYYGVLRLPFLRLLYAGPLVPVFFIVSGYVLSAKTIRHSHSWSSSPTTPTTSSTRSFEALFISLSGSAFRRALRLFPPPIISTFLVMLLTHLGLFSFNYAVMPGRQPVHPVPLDTLPAQLLQWSSFVLTELTNPWRWDVPPLLYGPHLWTIPMSFKGSAITFLSCLALSRVRPNARLSLLCAAIAHTLSRARWDMAPFLSGILLCELDVRFPSSPSKKTTPRIPFFTAPLIPFLTLPPALYLASFPRSNLAGKACVPGYQSLCRLTPNYRYWHALAAWMIMFSLSRSPFLQKPFISPLARYLGKVSFSVYLVHEPLLHVFGFWTVPFWWGVIGGSWYYQVGFGLGLKQLDLVDLLLRARAAPFDMRYDSETISPTWIYALRPPDFSVCSTTFHNWVRFASMSRRW
ncbi:acyltransferase family-domain-containing protein [Podospora aff. communis PSN243]|uniref:Acyltransferase family-domain-containing protein n=1 Tax=Podospora aff. communis PSN243 TaxID=3040156 RepID=A0AAV9G6E5_9PEZI|nr:acyltransferase family-domain-containing protein [Podospora aff. communis PSN243]